MSCGETYTNVVPLLGRCLPQLSLASWGCLPYSWGMPPSRTQSRSKYRNQRKQVSVPVVPVSVARKLAGKTLQDVCDHINAEFEFPKKVERGTISAIENGLRGASVEMLVAIASALGIPADEIDTEYEPRHARHPRVVA